MWQILRSLSDTFGVGFLAMQLVKLIGTWVALVGPLKFISGLFAGIFPVVAKFFGDIFGRDINGLDVMVVSIAVSGTLIVASSVATQGAMSTKYFWRFLLIPYALIVITISIMVQIATPVAELYSFGDKCQAEITEAVSFYGSSCLEMAPQLRMIGIDVSFAEVNGVAPPSASGLGLGLTLGYLMGLLPLIAVGIFFFKRLSVNKLLKRVAIAAGSAIGLVAASAAFAAVVGS
ncbi:MAG: hypothetical protein HRT81_02995 [Henriciella sp.]|nr:hypothetical protein [Henriciella sp.]